MDYEEQVRQALNAAEYRRAYGLPYGAPVPEWAYHRRRETERETLDRIDREVEYAMDEARALDEQAE